MGVRLPFSMERYIFFEIWFLISCKIKHLVQIDLSTKTVFLLFTVGFHLAPSIGNKLCSTAQLVVDTVTACQAAATFLSLTFVSSFASPFWPKGCFGYSSCLSMGCSPQSVYFNTHNTGITNGHPSYAVQICTHAGKI